MPFAYEMISELRGMLAGVIGAAASFLWCCAPAYAQQTETSAPAQDRHHFTAQIDLRAVASNALPSFVHGGLGLTRFDDNHEGAQFGRAVLEYRGRWTDTLNAHVVLDTYGDGDKNPLDFTEAYLEWRPFPRNAWRWRARAGFFYPPVSLENSATGWDSAYSISSSAINTWLGEEIRGLGTEVNATWMGTRLGHAFDLSVLGGVFEGNDPAGVVIFQRGWALHDRQTGLFGGLPVWFSQGTSRQQLELFHEIDHRAGFYAGGQMDWPTGFGSVRARVLRYDNRGDPAVRNRYEAAWLTRFNSAGIEIQLPREWTVLGQWMDGDTSVGPSADGRGLLIADYEAWFALVSRRIGRHRASARWDGFYTRMARGWALFDGYQDGDAQTLAYTFDYDDHWQGLVEASRIDSELRQRSFVGIEPRAVEKTLQIALRYSFKQFSF